MSAGSSNGQVSKAAIKEAFLKFYAKKPLAQISVKEISDSCSLSRTTFYFYFEDINALYQECVQDAMRLMDTSLPDLILFTVGHDFDRYVSAYTSHLTDVKKNRALYSALLLGSESESFREQWLGSIYRHYEKTMSFSRNVRPELKENLIRFFSSGELGNVTAWILSGCKTPENTIALSSAQILFYGVFGANLRE